MKLSINKNIVNKNDHKAHQSKNFESHDLTADELANHINAGYAFSYQFENSHRKAENFICSDIIAADFDDGMTLEEAMQNEYLINNACILYTTASHTAEKHRFRVIFELPHTITDKEMIHSAQTGLTRKFPADVAAVDAARQFYGSRGSNPHIFGNVLSEENLDELIKLGKEKLNLSDSSSDNSKVAGSRSQLTVGNDIQVKNAQGKLCNLTDLKVSTPIFCPYHHDKSPSAFTTLSKSGSVGIHCASCQQTFWTKDSEPPPYNFFEFDEWVKTRIPAAMDDETESVEYEPTSLNIKLKQPYLNGLELMNGITLIKSPKGSGKTQYLKQIVKEFKSQNKSVLLVGHRRNLLRSLSTELGLECYLDSSPNAFVKRSKHFAVSVDSIGNFLDPMKDKFHAVLIDESEQVFSHITSSMLSTEKRRLCYQLLKHYIRRSNVCIALDADLNTVTMSAMQGFGSSNPFADTHLVLNEYKPKANQIEIYDSENHLLAQLKASITNRERLFVCCNSKKKVDILVQYISREFGDDITLFSITSENSDKPEVIHFVQNIKEEILKYNIVLVSPALGTGTDITFPEGESLVDGVYGFFDARINTHHDIDQQLSRVRNPGFVKVWISPLTFNFETEVEPIKQELVKDEMFSSVLRGFSRNGTPEYDWNEEYFNLHATILSSQRASKNKLKEHFVALKKYNGWDVVTVVTDKSQASEGSKIANAGKALRREHYVSGVLNAISLDDEARDLLFKKKKANSLTESENFRLIRTDIEDFYHETVTYELIQIDNEGKYREQIRMLEGVISSTPIKKNMHYLLLKKIFSLANLFDQHGQFDASVVITSELLDKFSEFCIKNKPEINRVLNVDIRSDVKNKPMAQLNTFLRLCGLKTVEVGKKDIGKNRVYEYAIDPVKLSAALAVIAKRKMYISQFLDRNLQITYSEPGIKE